MAGKDRNLIERDGRYTTQLVVPLDRRPYLEEAKSEAGA